MNKSETVQKLATALSKAQAQMKPAQMTATNPFLKNRYADLGAVIEAAREPLKANGLSVSQLTISRPGEVGISTILMHESGEWIESTVTLPLGDEKGKSQAQVAGSIISYLRRYSLASILGMYADEDTDGSTGKPDNAKARPQAKADPKSKANKPSDKAWEEWFALADKAQQLGVAVPQVPTEVTVDELREIYGGLRAGVKAAEAAGTETANGN